MSHDALVEEYQRVLPQLERLARTTEDAVRALASEQGLVIHFVSSRVKTVQSLARKLARPEKTYRALWDVTDLVGVRVATYFEDAMLDVARVIERSFSVDFRHSVDKQLAKDPVSFGYRSLHYVCAPKGETPHPDFRLEIQVRTALQHAWAEVEHDLGYKADAVAPAIRRRFSRVASLLEIADEEFVAIRRDLEAYQAQVRAEVEAEGSIALDELALGALVRTPLVTSADAAVAGVLGLPCVAEPYYPSYLLTLLTLTGLTSTGAVREVVQAHGGALPQVVERYFHFAQRTWGFSRSSVAQVNAGYSLFFLAHLAVLRGPALELTKVARLASIYRQLDELDEPRAHELATGLAAALGR